MNRSILALCAAGVATLAMSGAALASTGLDARSVRVSYADLDLTRDADAARLFARLQQAADAVCDVGSRRELYVEAPYWACVNQALGEAVATVNNANVTARYNRTAASSQRNPSA
jgi:UrcA family protein